MNVIQNGGKPIKSWAVDPEAGAIEQATNLSKLPFVISHVALMPDAHQGYGMPVGGVLFADKAVVPYAIGVDIGCGVALIETDLTVDDIDPDRLTRFLAQVARDVPVGNGPQAQHQSAQLPFRPIDLDDHEGSQVLADAIAKASTQLGTLGGGNHFLELQASDDGRVWFMLHSGSRSVGKKVCDHWHKVALGFNRRWYSDLPHDELAYLPLGTEEFTGYWTDMTIALEWAEENRRRMARAVLGAFETVFGCMTDQILDVHHNYAAWENHRGRNGIVHRKGAVRAQAGETVLIPGSMSTGSYVAEGLGNPDSFDTCQHGAGRARSRAATRKMVTVEQMDAQLIAAGVTLVTPKRSDVVDESQAAYKDIEDVMAASTDLIRPIRRHRPLGVVKG